MLKIIKFMLLRNAFYCGKKATSSWLNLKILVENVNMFLFCFFVDPVFYFLECTVPALKSELQGKKSNCCCILSVLSNIIIGEMEYFTWLENKEHYWQWEIKFTSFFPFFDVCKFNNNDIFLVLERQTDNS